MDEADGWVVEAMLTFGGGFFRALARAAQLADVENLRRIKAAWPVDWANYAEMAVHLKKAHDRREEARRG